MNSAAYLRELANVSVPLENAFQDAEYEARLANVRAGMAATDLDILLVTTPSNICYLTGYDAFGVGRFTCLLLPRDGDAQIFLPSLELPQAYVTGRMGNIASYEWYEVNGIADRLATLITNLELQLKQVGIEAKRPFFPVDIFEKLKTRLPHAQFRDGSNVIPVVRLIKSATEIDYMRRAAAVTRAGIDASISAITEGNTDNDVASAGYGAMVGAGGEFFSCQPIVAAGYRSGLYHATFKRTRLKVGEPIILEYGGCYQRYTTPLMRTAVLGNASATIRRLADAVIETLNLVIENVKPGRTGHDVATAASKGMASLGPDVSFHGGYGYSVGLGFPPTWDEGLITIADGVDQVLKPGMTFHLPISCRLPGRSGVALSETIVVTERGNEVLSISKRRDIVVV